MKGRIRLLLFLAVTAGAGLFLSPGTGDPFDRSFQGWNPAWYAIAARNYLRRGILKLKFGMVLDCGVPSPKPTYYVDHPPLAALLCAGSFALFGEGEAQARGTALLLTALSAGLFFLFLLDLTKGSLPAATAGTAFFLGTPLLAYYGNMLDPQGSGVLFSMAGALWGAGRWARTGRRGDLLLSLAFLAFGLFYDWPAFLLAGFLGLWAIRSFGKERLPGALSFWAAGLAAGTLLLAWILWLNRESLVGGGIWEALKSRIPLGRMKDLEGKPLGLDRCLEGILTFHKKNFFLPLSLAGLAGAAWIAFLAGRRERRLLLALLPLAVGGLHVLLFPQGAFTHDYWQIYLAPGLALPAALAGARAAGGGRWRRTALPALFLLSAAVLLLGFHQARERRRGRAPYLEESRRAGRLLARFVRPDQFVLSSSSPAMAVNYYADRQIVWGMKSPELFLEVFGPWKKTGPWVGAFLLEARSLPAYRTFLESRAERNPLRAGRFLIFRKSP